MAFKVIILSLVLGLIGCITTPDFETGEGCWKYGVAENMPVVRTLAPVTVTNDDITPIACGAKVWGCYREDQHRIYIHERAENWKVVANHEQCHAIGLMEHNECYGKGYGIGKDESSCDWDN